MSDGGKVQNGCKEISETCIKGLERDVRLSDEVANGQ
jgi:hypothetical protein